MPLYNKHGITINDPDDITEGYHTQVELDAIINARVDVPASERVEFFQAVRVHWDHIHFVTDPDNVTLKFASDGSIGAICVIFDYGGLTGYDGLDIPAPPGIP